MVMARSGQYILCTFILASQLTHQRYDAYAEDIYILRPILFGTIGLKSGIIADINLRYSPQWYNLVANSTDVVFDGLTISGYSQSEHEAKNTDGWDTYRSENVVIQNSVINNGDDCVSFKPNSTEILVQNLHCNGSHGISVGSLGQYVGEVDIVENVLVSIGRFEKVGVGSRLTFDADLQHFHVECLRWCSHQGLARKSSCLVRRPAGWRWLWPCQEHHIPGHGHHQRRLRHRDHAVLWAEELDALQRIPEQPHD